METEERKLEISRQKRRGGFFFNIFQKFLQMRKKPPCVVSQQTSLYSVLPLKTKGIGWTLLKCMVPFYTSKHFQAEPGLSRGSCVYTRPSRYKSRPHWTQLRSRVEHCSPSIVCHLLSWKPSCGLGIAHIPLCVICCLENPAVVWELLTFHCVSSTVFKTQLWSGSMADRWRV